MRELASDLFQVISMQGKITYAPIQLPYNTDEFPLFAYHISAKWRKATQFLI